MTELKPCPLCGGNPKYDTGIKFWNTGSWWQVVCEKCHAASFPADTQEEAAMYWNKTMAAWNGRDKWYAKS